MNSNGLNNKIILKILIEYVDWLTLLQHLSFCGPVENVEVVSFINHIWPLFYSL